MVLPAEMEDKARRVGTAKMGVRVQLELMVRM